LLSEALLLALSVLCPPLTPAPLLCPLSLPAPSGLGLPAHCTPSPWLGVLALPLSTPAALLAVGWTPLLAAAGAVAEEPAAAKDELLAARGPACEERNLGRIEKIGRMRFFQNEGGTLNLWLSSNLKRLWEGTPR
jgi:hypothetical protein